MSMSKANILHNCIGELMDEHIHDDEVLSEIYEMLVSYTILQRGI